MAEIIEMDDPVYTFCEVVRHIDLYKYLAQEESRTGRPRYDEIKLMKIVLFAFMENGYVSVRMIEKLCKTDIRFLWILDGTPAPSFMTIDNFMNKTLKQSIQKIFQDINSYIFEQEHVDLNHVYLDGTKITANANRYSWVWKKSCAKNRQKVFEKVTKLIEEINAFLLPYSVKIGVREEYAIEYLEEMRDKFVKITGLDLSAVVRGRGHRKTPELRCFDQLTEFIGKLRRYVESISICGEKRNSYSKTDHDATFMRMKRDYMGNDQLLPGYNIQIGVCDGYIAVFDVNQYASDMDCFQPLMEKFYAQYGFFPQYPIADAGYGSFNNYLFCEEHGMEKFMKFPTYQKESKDPKYRDDPYRAVNFPINEKGCPVCPGGKEFHFMREQPVKGNRYGRTEELYRCEDCTDCSHRKNCFKGKENRVIRLNRELTSIHQEVLGNLNCIHGALLRMNRSIQAEGAFGEIKWNRAYTRARRRGISGLLYEISMISCGFNLHKFHLRNLRIKPIG